MRIISGKLKGKKINPPKDKITRPLRDLVKESIFNVIKHSNNIKIDIEKSVILDLFSGSGYDPHKPFLKIVFFQFQLIYGKHEVLLRFQEQALLLLRMI